MAALGSLVVKLALDYAQFTAGMSKSEQAALEAGKRVQDTMDNLERKVATTVGAIAGGIAAAFTINAFKGLISGAIESSAALHDLSIMTGASVEALSGLAAIGKYSDQTAESIGGAMNKLAKNMAGATEESKGTGKALDALGLDFDKFKQLSPEDQMLAVAKAMDGFADGSGKAAVAMALYGKEGAKMLPFLQDIAGLSEIQAKVTTEQANAADNFDDNLKRVTASGDAWKKQLALGMIPALDQSLTAVLEVTNGTGGLRAMVKKLVDDGSIAAWTSGAIRGFSYLIDVGQGLIGILRIIAATIRAVIDYNVYAFSAIGDAAMQAKAGDFAGAWQTIKAGASQVKSVVVETGNDISKIWNEKLLGERFRDVLDKNQAAGPAAETPKARLDFANNSSKGDKTDKAAEQAIALQIEAIAGQIKSTQRELKSSLDSAKADYDLGLLSTQQYLDRTFELRQNALGKELDLAAKQEELAKGKKNIEAAQRYKNEYQRILDDMAASWEKHANDKTVAFNKATKAIEAFKQTLSDSFATRGQAIDDSLQGAGLGPVAIEQLQRMTALRRDVDKKRADLARDFAKGEGAGGIGERQYSEQLAALDGYWADRIAQEQSFNDQSKALRVDWSLGAKKAVNTYLESAQDIASQTNDLWTRAITGMEDVLTTFITTGKLSFKGLANAVIADIARMEAKALLSKVMGGSSGGGSGLGGILSLVGAIGGQGAALGFGNAASAVGGDGLGAFIAASGWAGGGYTGHGGVHEFAGFAHKGEVIWSQDDVREAGGPAVVDAMRQGRLGYADGGVVGGGALPIAPGVVTSSAAATPSIDKPLTIVNRTTGRADSATYQETATERVITMDEYAAEFDNPSSRASRNIARTFGLQPKR